MGDKSDVLGFFVIAPDFFARAGNRRKIAVVFSDMGESASVDLERPSRIDVTKEMAQIEALGLVADFRGIEIYVFGVHAAADKSTGYLLTLKTLWACYFKATGADLKTFSMDRDVSVLREVLR